jgi:hypothetical protein
VYFFFELVTFGSDMDVDWFTEFRQRYGPQACHLSAYKVFSSQPQDHRSILNTYLRRDDQMWKAIDLIHLEMLSASPSFRPTAKEIVHRVLMIGKGMSFFRKESCCQAPGIAARVSDPPEKSLLEKMAQLSLTDIEKIDKHGFAGKLVMDCFGD